jgi:hypothetical protein
MMSDKDTLYMKIVGIDEIYKFLVLNFVIWCHYDSQKNNIKFQHHINRVAGLVTLIKSFLYDVIVFESYSPR